MNGSFNLAHCYQPDNLLKSMADAESALDDHFKPLTSSTSNWTSGPRATIIECYMKCAPQLNYDNELEFWVSRYRHSSDCIPVLDTRKAITDHMPAISKSKLMKRGPLWIYGIVEDVDHEKFTIVGGESHYLSPVAISYHNYHDARKSAVRALFGRGISVPDVTPIAYAKKMKLTTL